MSYYICGIGLVTPKIMGSAREFKTVNTNHGKLNPLSRKDVLAKPYKPFGRMDFFSKIGFAGIHFACKDAGIFNNNRFSDTSIIAATKFGCLNTDYDYFNTIKTDNGKNASPQIFVYTLANTFLGEASIFHNFTGESFVIGDYNAYKKELLNMSFDILDSSISDFVICGLCDTEPPEFIGQNNDHFYGSIFFVI
ncbi:hypothetical protein KAJ27_25725, partial [bacterium]|nr:hypothetical protein [bacterium]